MLVHCVVALNATRGFSNVEQYMSPVQVVVLVNVFEA